MPFTERIQMINTASALTHAHERSKLGCGIYAYILTHILSDSNKSAIYTALIQAREYYCDNEEFKHYARLFRHDFDKTECSQIKSGGYVVDTLEAAVWCLLTTDNYRDCVLKAVNLGDDTDTVASVAGGLAGALYGYDAIPREWIDILKCHEYIDNMCERATTAWLQKHE